MRLDPRGLPPIGSRRTWPRSRKRLTQLSTLSLDNPNRRAAAETVMPSSTTAATARLRNSSPTGRPRTPRRSSPPADPPSQPEIDSVIVFPPPAAPARPP